MALQGGNDANLVDSNELKRYEKESRDTKANIKGIVVDHNELKSIRTILDDPMATAYFRHFFRRLF